MRTKSRPANAHEKAPTNFDEVKRRFIRQNRELAKNNSTQSLRIRSLELDVSRLLQTNLELREEVLRLRSEVHNARRQSAREGVERFKEEMVAKLREMSRIVESVEMDETARDKIIREERAERRRSVMSTMDFRERQPLVDAMRECQMPTIDELEQAPRRTMNAEEVKATRLSDHSNESPDLGPPPVARFECEDPIKFDAQAGQDAQQPAKSADDDELPANLSVNLETRKKRKDGQSKLEIRRHSILPPPSPPNSDAETIAPILRTAAKRKLADRELDRPSKTASSTDFMFSRKTAAEPPKPVASTDAETEKPVELVEVPTLSPKANRRVLGDKSVNMSPRKATAPPAGKPDKGDAKKPAFQISDARKERKERIAARRSLATSIPPPPPPPQEDIPITTIESPTLDIPGPTDTNPKTPAPADLFSPTPSEPSAARPAESRDTPPPSALSSLTASIAASGIEGARPSRRARSAVNYAEPSLNTKMRRPDKKMVDALTGLQDPRRAMSSSVEREVKSGKGVAIKTEPEDEDAWKNLPVASGVDAETGYTSPLTGKTMEAKDTEVASASGSSDPLTKPSPPALTTFAPSSRARRRESLQQQQLQEQPCSAIDVAAKKLEELDLYDFKDSSSPSSVASSTASSTTGSASSGTAAASGRSHRRHSSVPKAIATALPEHAVKAESLEMEKGKEKIAARAGRTTAGGGSRRRSMML